MLLVLVPFSSNSNVLTGQYYASKCIQHVKHSILRPQVASWPQMEEEARLTYQDILTNIAILLGADTARAARDMHDVIAFEIELSMVRAGWGRSILILIY